MPKAVFFITISNPEIIQNWWILHKYSGFVQCCAVFINFQKTKKEKTKSKTEEATDRTEEAVSSKAKSVKKKGPAEDDVDTPKPKKTKKQEEAPQDDTASKSKTSKKKKEPLDKKASAKTKEIKAEEPSEEDADVPKPKKMKKGKEANGDIGEKSPNLKNGFSHAESSDATGEDSSETEKVRLASLSSVLIACAWLCACRQHLWKLIRSLHHVGPGD